MSDNLTDNLTYNNLHVFFRCPNEVMDSNKKRKTNAYNNPISLGKENTNNMSTIDDSQCQASHPKIAMTRSQSIVGKGPTYAGDMVNNSGTLLRGTTPLKDISNSKFTHQF